MKFYEALRLMMEDGKLFRFSGSDDIYFLDKNHDLKYQNANGDIRDAKGIMGNYLNLPWELVPDPKKTVKMVFYDWVFGNKKDDLELWTFTDPKTPGCFKIRHRIEESRREIEVLIDER